MQRRRRWTVVIAKPKGAKRGRWRFTFPSRSSGRAFAAQVRRGFHGIVVSGPG